MNSEAMIEDCAVPQYGEKAYEFPMQRCEDTHALWPPCENLRTSSSPNLERQQLPPATSCTTTGSPVHVSRRRIISQPTFKMKCMEVHLLLHNAWNHSGTLQSIPALYCQSSQGRYVRLCVDYRELNKRTVKDAYLPLATSG